MWQQDVWYGKAVAYKAHVKVMRGDLEGASKLLEDKDIGKILQDIDSSLKEEVDKGGDPSLLKLSPMAECRYLLGVMLQAEAWKLIDAGGESKEKDRIVAFLLGPKRAEGGRGEGALQHFANVFIGYPGTSWAPDAGRRMRQIKEWIEKTYGAKVNINVTPEQMATAETLQYQEARSLFNQQQYDKAIEQFLVVLNVFPDGETALASLHDLALCYVELGTNYENTIFCETVMRHMAERFSGKPALAVKTGDVLCRLAELLGGEKKRPELKAVAYELFFQNLPNHPMVPATLFRFGDSRLNTEDYDGAMDYYRRIVNQYTNHVLYKDAMFRVAHCYSKLGDTTNEMVVLRQILNYAQNKADMGMGVVEAKSRIAYALRAASRSNLVESLRLFDEVVKALSDEQKPVAVKPDDIVRAQALLESAVYSRASTIAQLTEPADKVPALRAMAVKQFEDYVQRYPTNRLAAAALSQVGTLYTLLNQPEKADAALRRLQADYKESPEAKNALFMRGLNLLELDQRPLAIKLFKEMFQEGGGKYSDSQVLKAAQELLKAGEVETALEGFAMLVAGAKDAPILHSAYLAKAECLTKLGRYAEALTTLQEYKKKYPNPPSRQDIAKLTSRVAMQVATTEPDAKRREELFSQALAEAKIVRQYGVTDGAKIGSDLEMARMFVLRSEAEAKAGNKANAIRYKDRGLATYLIVTMSDPDDPDIRRHIETALYEAVPVLIELGRYKEASEFCDKYFLIFKEGKYSMEMLRWRSKARANVETTVQEVEKAPAAAKAVPKTARVDAADAASPVPRPASPAKGTNAVVNKGTGDG
jgi:TolA-binding protein